MMDGKPDYLRPRSSTGRKQQVKRSKMPRSERAKQFAPFSPLNGLNEALRLKELEHSSIDRIEMTEDRACVVNEKLSSLYPGEQVEATYYSLGHYKTLKGVVSEINSRTRTLTVDDTEIHFKDLYDIKTR